MKLNYDNWNILKNQLNNREKRKAKILYNITNELKKIILIIKEKSN